MNSRRLNAILGLLLVGCAAAPPSTDGTSLLAPAGLSLDERKKNLNECDAEAYAGARSGLPLTEQQKAQLQGRSTVKFYREGRRVVNSEYTPNMWLSLIGSPGGYVSSDVSDRYVLCFLARGYTWPNPNLALRNKG
jgi:hypothetical protein